MPVTADTLRLQRQIRLAVDHVTDQQTRDLVRAWAEAWDEVEPELNETLLRMLTAGGSVTRADLLRSERLRKVLAQIADELERLSTQAGVRIVGDLRDVVETAGAAQASVLDSQLPPGYSKTIQLEQWSHVDPRAVQAIVRRTTQQITSRLQPLARETSDIIRRELIRGVATGANPKVTARRMVARSEQRFNGDLGMTRALRVARTETLDAHRDAAHLGRLQNTDVLAQWMWICELSKRSCPSCIAQHGSLHPIDEVGPNDHVSGRCTGMPVTKSWSDLGFDIAEPPSFLVDGKSWFADQSEADQRRILGPSRYESWKQGDYPVSSWSVVRHNPGWRDSIQVSRVPQRSVALAS